MLAPLAVVLLTTVLAFVVFAVAYREARASMSVLEAAFDAGIPAGMLALAAYALGYYIAAPSPSLQTIESATLTTYRLPGHAFTVDGKGACEHIEWGDL